MKKRKWIGTALLLLCFGLLSGCFMKSADELYAVPKRSDTYTNLQEAVESAMGGSGVYCAPVSGDNRQAIQQADLDGDGADEFIAFARVEGVKPLKIFVFQRDGDEFNLAYRLEGDGAAFDSVQYVQIDGAPGLEMIIGRRVSEQVLQSMSVCTFKKDGIYELATPTYSAYTTADLNNDGLTDLFIVRADSDDPNAVAELYCWQAAEFVRQVEANLSFPAESVKRIITGNMSENVPAVFVAGTYDENNIITDVFVVLDGVFRNVSFSDENGASTQTVRNYYVYSADIDSDGLTEIPNTVLLPELPWDVQSREQYLIIWGNLNADGSRTEKLYTYHNYADGWYLTLPEQCRENLAVTRRSQEGTPGYCFCRINPDDTVTEILTIYAFTGDNAAELAEADGRSLLLKKDHTYFSTLLGEAAADYDLDLQTLQAMFHIISTDAANNVTDG